MELNYPVRVYHASSDPLDPVEAEERETLPDLYEYRNPFDSEPLFSIGSEPIRFELDRTPPFRLFQLVWFGEAPSVVRVYEHSLSREPLGWPIGRYLPALDADGRRGFVVVLNIGRSDDTIWLTGFWTPE